MTDYTYPASDDLSDKDALPSGNAEKIILGSDLEAEFQAIATAIASKYDSGDIASQAQAEAEASNTVLMTPQRVAEWADANGGLVGDIQALADPGADRLIFWDDSAGAAAFLTLGTGLSISGTTISSDDANIDHDALTNFVANEHVDHTAVSPLAGAGLAISGSNIASDFTYSLDINGLTAESSIATGDTVAVYDDSAGAIRKATVANLVGAAGANVTSGRWYRNSTQALAGSTATTVVFNTEEYDSLSKGSFSTATGQYTVGGAATTVLVTAGIQVTNMPVDTSLIISVQVNGTTRATVDILHQAGTGTENREQAIAVPLSLSASDVVRVRVTASSAMNIGGSVETYVGIVELS